jgi:membrane protein DedA with SNARE-associated domain
MTGLKKLSRGLVIGLAVVIALVSYNVTIPAGKSSGSNWRFVATHPTILLHIIAASAVLVMSVIMLIRSLRRRQPPWILLSVAGMAFVILAYAAGEDYVTTLRKSALSLMSAGWFGAIVSYGVGWYLGRKQERASELVRS